MPGNCIYIHRKLDQMVLFVQTGTTAQAAYPKKPGQLQLVTFHLPLQDLCFVLCI